MRILHRQLSPREIRAIKAKQFGSQWSKKIPFTRETIKLLKNNSGNYEFFNHEGKKIYVGSTNILKHRVESYSELDDFNVHPTKKALREEIKSFRFRYLPIQIAEKHEQRIKQGLPFNMDSHIHEEIKREKQ